MIQNDKLNELTKQKHDLIRKLEKQEITHDEYDKGYLEVRKQIDSLEKEMIDKNKPVEPEVKEVPKKETKKKTKKGEPSELTKNLKLIIEDVIKTERTDQLFGKTLKRINPMTEQIKKKVYTLTQRVEKQLKKIK